jgi:PAS domain S-box-containing protein
MASAMRLRYYILFMMVGLLAFFTIAASLDVYITVQRTAESGLDGELRTAALLAREMLPPGYHERIDGRGSVSDAEYLAIVERFNRLCVEADLAYLWSLMVLDGKIVFTSATSPGKDAATGDHAAFLEVHSNPELYRRVFETMQPQYQVNADKWGRIRVGLVPFRDARGRPWLMGASRSMAHVDARVGSLRLFVAISALVTLLLGTLLAHLLARSLSRPIEEITRAATRIAEGDFAQVVQVGGAREIRLLGASITGMSRAIRGRMEEVEKSRRQLARVMEGTDDGFWDWDIQTGSVRFSDRWAAMLGYAPDEIPPHISAWESLLHPDDAPAVTRALEDHMAGKTPFYQSEQRLRTKSGDWKWILDRGKVLTRSAEGTPLTAAGTHTDISERKAAEAALQASEARFRSMFKAMTEGVALHEMILDTAGAPVDYVILDVNPAFERITGVRRTETLNVPASRLYGMTPPPYLAEYSRVSLTGEPDHFETWYEPMQKHFSISAASSGPNQFITIFDDITHAKKEEEERRSLERQVQQAQKLESLGVLAGGIAHDFSNLLVAVMGNADLALAEMSPASPARESIKEIEKASQRAAELCRQMLAYSGKGRYVVECLDLAAVVKEMAHMLEVSISKKALLKYRFTPGMPPVKADATQLRQVIMNLIINASEAIGEKSGVITITVGAMTCDRAYLSDVYLDETLEEGLYVTLEVSDTGIGMDEQTRRKIFDPFFTTKFAGRGLGLAAVLGIVRGHRGALKVYSEPGRGSTFKVLLPAAEGESEREKGAAAVNGAAWKGSGTVLLVDDEESVRSLGRRMLERLGYTVVTACDGREALSIFGREGAVFSIVILDLTMPHLDGEQAFRALKQIDPRVKVIISSGYNEQEVTQTFAGKGLAGFIQKPYTMAMLTAALQQASAASESEGP